MRKRILSVLLMLALCLAYLPVQAYAAELTEITVTGIESTYAAGGVIANDLADLYITSSSEVGVMSDGKYLTIDGTDYFYPWDTSLVWEAGKTYTLTIPLQATDPDTFSSTMTATVNGELTKLSDITETSAKLVYPITIEGSSDSAGADAGESTDPAATTDPAETTDPTETTDPAETTEPDPAAIDEEASYDFTPPRRGAGSYTVDDTHWTWGDRAQLPEDVAELYETLTEDDFLEGESLYALPAKDPSGPSYEVDETLICEDHEPVYTAGGGKVDESTFGNSEFYVVRTGSGDKKIDFPNLKTGDVVSNTTFNGVFITKVQKTGNGTYDADLAKLKSDSIAAFRAFELDHPEVFWLNGSVKLRVLTVTVSGTQTSYIFMTLADDSGFTMRIADYAAAGAIEAAVAQRDAAVAAILAQIPAGSTPRQTIANLNKWFTLHNEYNRSADLNAIGYTPHRALKSLLGNEGVNGPVCDGYSRGLKVICDKLGIPVVLDTGMATINGHSELHMWNRIRIDGTWYGTDCTWNDPIVSGKNGKVSGHENEKYLLVGDDTVIDGMRFGASHPSNKAAGGTSGTLFASLGGSKTAVEGYQTLPFTDVGLGDWFYEQVKVAYANNIVGGMTATTYGPTGQLTHAQIMVMVANLHAKQKSESVPSSTGSHWAAKFQNYCKAEGIIDSRFDAVLDKPVSRGEMAYYFANALSASSYKNKKAVSLSDIASEPYKAEIERLAAADIVGGYNDGTFKATKLVTRAEAAVFVKNIIEAMQ